MAAVFTLREDDIFDEHPRSWAAGLVACRAAEQRAWSWEFPKKDEPTLGEFHGNCGFSSRSSSIFFHLFMRDSISRFLHARISSTAQWMSWKPQVQQSHCRASMATTGEKAWVCRSRWKGPEKLALGFQLSQNWYLLIYYLICFRFSKCFWTIKMRHPSQVRMTYPVELQVIHLAGMPNWVRVALGFSPRWDQWNLIAKMGDSTRPMSIGARRFFWTINSTQRGLVLWVSWLRMPCVVWMYATMLEGTLLMMFVLSCSCALGS